MKRREWTQSLQLGADDPGGLTATIRISRTRLRVGAAFLSALVPAMVTFFVASVVGFFLWNLTMDAREMALALGAAGVNRIATIVAGAAALALGIAALSVRRRSTDLFGKLVPARESHLEWRPDSADMYRTATQGFLKLGTERLALDNVQQVLLSRSRRTVAGLRREVAELELKTLHGRRAVLPPYIGERERIETLAQRLAERLRVPLEADDADLFLL